MKADHKLRAKGKKGSIALEAAISVSLFIVMSVFLLTAIIASQIEAAVSTALDNTAAEISLLIPLAEIAVESNDAVKNTLAELEQIDQQLTQSEFIAELTGYNITDLLSSAVFSGLISQRCQFWLNDAACGQQLYLHLLEDLDIGMKWQTEYNALLLEADIEIQSLLGNIKREAVSVVPIWTGKSHDSTSMNDDMAQDVWSMDNFSRGIYLREHFGAELPLCYPVIASFNNGEAIAIRSIDLTAPSYQSEGRVVDSVAQELVKLAAFDGYAGSANMPPIDGASIMKRKLKLIIPQNSPSSFDLHIRSQLEELASSSNINLEIIRYLDSERYEA